MSMDALAADKPWLMLGDCLERMSEIPEGSVDAVVCDLPFGMTKCPWYSVIPLQPLWAEYSRVIKDNGVVVLNATQPFTTTLISSNVSMFKYTWVWEKNLPTGMILAKSQPMRVTEDIVVFYRKHSTYNKQPTRTLIQDRKVIQGRRNGTSSTGGKGHHNQGLMPRANIQKEYVNPRNLLKIPCVPNAGGGKLHSSQKPVALLEYLIRTYTNPGETVLDNAAGSFSTGVACINTGRRFIGIEKDEVYFNVGRQRIENAIAAMQPANSGGFSIAQAAE